MKQLIKEATRSTLTTAKIIDHFVATNNRNSIISSGVFTTGFSDNDRIFSIRKVSSCIKRERKILKTQQLKHYDAQKFQEDLKES